MSALERRAAAIGARVAAGHRMRLAAALDAVAGVNATIEEEAVAVRGRGLARRLLDDPQLRGVRP